MNITGPLFFDRNRIYRVYRGGSLFSNFYTDKNENTYYPEEWIASTVNAIGTPHDDIKNYGFSKIRGTEITFKEILDSYPREMLGDIAGFNIFAKLFHSAERLPVQTHPDSLSAQKHFGSPAGKEEAWLFLSTEEDAEIFYGFKDGVKKKDFIDAIDRSETDKNIMPSLLNTIKVSKGDVYFVPGGIPHTIGKGCLVLEIQEATDYMVLSEHWCDSKHMEEPEMFQGLEKENAVECFNFNAPTGDAIIKRGKIIPEVIIDEKNIHAERLISNKQTKNFNMNYYDIKSGSFKLDRGPSIIIPIDGEAIIRYSGFSEKIKKGQYFFLPFAAKDTELITTDGIKIVECLPKR